MTASDGPRADMWLRLLREVTAAFPRWAVWKNVASALEGHGDVDSFAPPADWPGIEEVWRAWLEAEGLGPPIVCRHVPQGPHFVALEPGSPWIVQFDVKEMGTFRGSKLIDVDDLARLSEIDARGFRRIRPGAEGVLKLLYNGMRTWGRRDDAGLASKRVAELLRADPEGARLAARLLGPAHGAVERAVERYLAGGWDRPALVAAEAWALLRSVTQPRVAGSRIWFNQVGKKRCPVLQSIRRHDRRIPGGREAWLAEVARTHRGVPVEVA